MIIKFFADKLNQSKLNKVLEVANKLNLNPNWLLAVMYFESARTFSPSITNHIGSVGLIQFTRDKAGVDYKTINGKRYYLSGLKAMTFEKQMDVVYEYYKPYASKITSFIDTYLVTFFPVALGKSDDFVFKTSGLSASLIAKQNPAFDSNKDAKIQKLEVVKYFEKLYTKLGVDFSQIDTKDTSKKCSYCSQIYLGIAVFFYSVFTIYLVIN